MTRPLMLALAAVVVVCPGTFSSATESARSAGLAVPDTPASTSATPAALGGGDSDSRYETDLDRPAFDAAVAQHAAAGRSLVDVEVRWDGIEERYSAVFFPVGGAVHTLIQGTTADWTAFMSTVGALDGRYLDVEVAFFDGTKRYSAIFYEDGDDYSWALRTTNTEDDFQGWLDQYLREGRAIVDFEAYLEPDGDLKLAGVWVDDPNQPRTVLYYHLEAADISDLLRPLAGRLIDFERYWSPLHGEHRYAVIAAMYGDGGWGHFRWQTLSELDDKHAQIADADTHLSDIEEWESGGTLYYGALWGDTYKSLYEVDAIPADPDPEPIPTDLNNLLVSFEVGGQGVIGLYAKNLRTDQSFAFRRDEPFYLASSAKTAIHVKLHQELEADRIHLLDRMYYTECDDCRNDWYVTEDSFPGFNSSDFGDDFTILRFDQGMMDTSDNAATSALVDDETYGVSHDVLDLNEWLSGLSGIGRGWWPVTSIHDVDRTIGWQGQVTAFPSDTSVFTVPGWASAPYIRGGSDTWDDLDDYLGNPASLPRMDRPLGHERYYAMGLNSSTPQAFAALLEALWEERLLGEAATRDAITRMTEPTPLDDLLPAYVDVFAKGGVKGGASHPVSDTGIFEIGPDAIAIAVVTKDNSRSTGTIRSSFTAPIALEVLEGLTANLAPDDGSGSVPDGLAIHGEPWEISVDVSNLGGGDCGSGFDVTFYASANQQIHESDHEIGTVSVPSCSSGDVLPVTWSGAFPTDVPEGRYWMGWIADPDRWGLGDVGESNEGDNAGRYQAERVTVTLDDPGDELWVDGPSPPGVDRRAPRVAMDGLGRSIVVWEAFNAAGGDRNDVFVRVFDDAGEPLGPPVMVNTTTAEDQRYPVVAAQDDGDFLVVWQSEEPMEEVLRARLFTSTGIPVTTELLVNQTSTGENHRVDFDADVSPSGGFVVVWGVSTPTTEANELVLGRRISSGGAPIGDEIQLNQQPGGVLEHRPAVAYAPDGTFTAVWQVDTNGIEARRFSAGGAPLGPEFVVTQTGTVVTPDVAIDATGRMLFSWKGDDDVLDGRLYDSTGSPTGPVFGIGTSAVHDDTYPHGTAVVDGSMFVLTWETMTPAGDDVDRGIDARIVIDHDQFQGPTFQVNQYAPDTQQDPAVAARSDQMMFVWKGQRSPYNLNDDVIQGRLMELSELVLLSASFETGDFSGWSVVVQ